jgi:hypothetical protein
MNKLHGCIAVLIILAGFGFFIFTVTSQYSQSRPLDSLKTEPNPKQPKKIVAEITTVSQDQKTKDAVCLFTLRFDRNGMTDKQLQQDASIAITKLRGKFQAGTDTQTLLSEVFNGMSSKEYTKTIEKKYDKIAQLSQPAPMPTSVYTKYKPEFPLTGCYASEEDVIKQFNEFFIHANPTVVETIRVTKPGTSSMPVILNETTIENTSYPYAYLLIVKT